MERPSARPTLPEVHSVERHLSVTANAYDEQIRRFIPHYDEMIATGVATVAALVRPDARVVDLGAGTGALSEAILRAMPGAHVTLVDVDRAMLDEARARLRAYGDRAAFREASFLDPLPAADAIVASLALHHVHAMDDKTMLYEMIHRALAPGGAFASLDAVVSEDERLRGRTFDDWAAHMVERGISEPQARAHFDAWAKEDRYFPLADELAALRRAGFTQPECFWRRAPLGVFGGVK